MSKQSLFSLAFDGFQRGGGKLQIAYYVVVDFCKTCSAADLDSHTTTMVKTPTKLFSIDRLFAKTQLLQVCAVIVHYYVRN